MIVDNRLVQLGNIVQGHADVFIADIDGSVGFVEQRPGKRGGWFAYDGAGLRISIEPFAKRDHAVRGLAESALEIPRGARVIDSEEIRRVIAWHLCGTMPPDDATLRTIYADYVSLDSLGVDSIDRAELVLTLEEKFPALGEINDEHIEWQTIGDVIRFVTEKTKGVAA